MPQPLLYDSHMHTPLCRHAVGEVDDYAAAAVERGLAGIIVTCHNPLPDGLSRHVRMTEAQWPDYLEMVEQAREASAGRLDVRVGMEADYIPGIDGLVDFVERQLASAPLHYVLGSVHCHIGEYLAQFRSPDPLTFQQTYFDHLAESAETGLFDCLAHPDLVKGSTPDDWEIDRILPDIQRALDRIAAAGVAMELNTSGRNKAYPETNPGPTMLREMCIRQIPVVLGSDSHVPHRVADHFEQALDTLESVGYTHVYYFQDRQRQAVPIPDARASLTAPTSTG